MSGLIAPLALVAAPFALLAGVLAIRSARLARDDGARLASAGALPAIRRASLVRVFRGAACAIAMLFVVVALARPAGAPVTVPAVAKGADVIIAIDVSLSMLATDARPSRLERARAVLRDLVERLDGDRIGLVAFSGSSSILLPLTLDTDAVRLFAEQLQVASVDAPGTAIDRAVDRSIEMFESAGEGERVLIVLSDGEDLSADPLAVARGAAERASEAGIRVASVAVGTGEGANIPLDVLGSNTLKRGPDGEAIVTRARLDVMSALGGQGLAIAATSGDEADRIAAWIGPGDASPRASGERVVRAELFQVPLAIGLLLLLVEYAAGAWRGQ